ncbi:MAG UNVERIFIED_CONTAM: hypothetical protein LVQ98_01720 [Rickettsiaceae bacterium]
MERKVFLFSALFNGEHRFILEDMGDETKFVHEEDRLMVYYPTYFQNPYMKILKRDLSL